MFTIFAVLTGAAVFGAGAGGAGMGVLNDGERKQECGKSKDQEGKELLFHGFWCLVGIRYGLGVRFARGEWVVKKNCNFRYAKTTY